MKKRKHANLVAVTIRRATCHMVLVAVTIKTCHMPHATWSLIVKRDNSCLRARFTTIPQYTYCYYILCNTVHIIISRGLIFEDPDPRWWCSVNVGCSSDASELLRLEVWNRISETSEILS
jgi:hypothetical protein